MPRWIILFTVFVTDTAGADDASWRISLHEASTCLVCNENGRDPLNVEIARLRSLGNSHYLFREWSASLTVVPGKTGDTLHDDAHHDMRLYQLGIALGVRTPGTVNFISRVGVHATRLTGPDGYSEPTARIELGAGIGERFEITGGIGTDLVGLHVGWRF